MTEELVRAEHIGKSFSGVAALRDVSLSLRSGEVHALLGENGAGKSTLMKIVSGVYTRDAGELWIMGEQVADLTPHSAQERGIAIIHQELNLCSSRPKARGSCTSPTGWRSCPRSWTG